MIGRITTYLPHRHFGFLVSLDGTKTEYFFHQNDCDFEPKVGLHVNFALGRYNGKVKAFTLKIIPLPAEILAGAEEGGAR
jgi:hypothetical protein